MKTFLPIIVLVILCSSCTEPTMKLRAPEVSKQEKQVSNDSLKNDTLSIQKQKLAD
jgi:hypothetical protein